MLRPAMSQLYLIPQGQYIPRIKWLRTHGTRTLFCIDCSTGPGILAGDLDLGGCPGSTDADILVVVCIDRSDNVCFGRVNSLAGLRYRAKAEDIGVVYSYSEVQCRK